MMWKSFILAACLVGVALGDSAPAFIWGSSSAPRPSLQTLSQDEFADILEPNLKDSMVVAFLEPELSNSDFACSKVKTEDSCYSNLKGVTPKTYYGSVQNPTEALRQISANREFATIDDAGVLENEISYEAGKVVFVSFDSPAEAIDRSELLEFHDAAISKVYNKLAKQGTITAVYTRTQSTDIGRTRRRRAAGDDTKAAGFVWRSTNVFLLYYSNLALQQGTGAEMTTTPINIVSMTVTDKNDTNFNVVLNAGSDNITFRMDLSEGYFEMSQLMWNQNETFYILPSINSLTTFSYYCGNQTFQSYTSDKVLIWDSLQMQAPFDSTVPETFVFGDPWYCTGFFTPGILAGLFVVIILLAIIAVGICWMMDINTMDRFDDPKGKTITINVSE